ncbi:MAG: mechanosensitive ion channel [Pirellulaceae bacterium]|nr:mechanosensitive ion channel [Pirellulaceae bacterium]
MFARTLCCVVLLCGLNATATIAWAQDTPATDPAASTDEVVQEVDVAAKVEVDPVNSDGRIAARLYDILLATEWFQNHDVDVNEGVVFLTGNTDSASHREWAEQTAMRTSDVVAVVNRIEVNEKPLWDLAPAIASIRELVRDFLTSLPLILIALLVALVFYAIAKTAASLTRQMYDPESDSKLLRQIVARVIGVMVFLIGMYLTLKIAGLTRLATTLLGGTGLIGLAIGFAFRDIAENFLSSILLSLNHPFAVDDLIEVDGTVGYVRKVTTRATILATFEGNQVQIPNSTVYKGKITNYTATPLRRHDFSVGIGFTDSAQQAQHVIMDVLTKHPAVESDPEPMVLVESLGAATVNLKCFYWFNQRENSGGKVKSALIRLVKQALMDSKISMPDEARELVFPTDVPVRLVEAGSPTATVGNRLPADRTTAQSDGASAEPQASSGEGDLRSEEADIRRATGNGETQADNILEE